MLVQPCILSRLASFFVEKRGTSNQKRKFNCVFFLRWWNILYNSKLRFLKIQHGQKKGWRWISINLFLLNKRKYYKVSNKKSQVLNLIDRDFEKNFFFCSRKYTIHFSLASSVHFQKELEMLFHTEKWYKVNPRVLKTRPFD